MRLTSKPGGFVKTGERSPVHDLTSHFEDRGRETPGKPEAGRRRGSQTRSGDRRNRLEVPQERPREPKPVL